MTATAPRKFNFGGRAEAVTHVWRTNPPLPGSRRFTWIFRACVVRQVVGDQAQITLVGKKSKPSRVVPASELIELPPKGTPLPWSMCE